MTAILEQEEQLLPVKARQTVSHTSREPPVFLYTTDCITVSNVQRHTQTLTTVFCMHASSAEKSVTVFVGNFLFVY